MQNKINKQSKTGKIDYGQVLILAAHLEAMTALVVALLALVNRASVQEISI